MDNDKGGKCVVFHEGKALRIRWNHVKDQHHTTHGGKSKVPKLCNGMTTCSVQVDEKGGEILMVGKSYCSIKEPYSYARGRYYSLRDMLKKHVPRNERMKFYKAYFETTNDLKRLGFIDFVLMKMGGA